MTLSSLWAIPECVVMRNIKMGAGHQKTQPWVLGFGLSVRGGQTDLTCRQYLERPEDSVQYVWSVIESLCLLSVTPIATSAAEQHGAS